MLNLFNIMITKANLVSTIERSFIFTCSLNMASLMAWFIMKFFMMMASPETSVIQLHFSYVISFASVFFAVHIFLRVRVKSVHHARSSTYMRIMSLHNGTGRLESLGIIGYDLDHILMSNLSNLLHKFIRNVEPVLCESLGVHGRQKHKSIFRDGYEINDRSPLCIRPSITTKRHPLRIEGSNFLSILGFSFCKRVIIKKLYPRGI